MYVHSRLLSAFVAEGRQRCGGTRAASPQAAGDGDDDGDGDGDGDGGDDDDGDD